MNMVFLGGDLFTLYVALELLTFAAVPLVCLDGRAEHGRPRCDTCSSPSSGSILDPVGSGPTLRQLDDARHRPAVPPRSYGARDRCRHADDHRTFAKTALFPLQLRLPPAQAGAPAAASAVLSAVVVKGSSSSSCGSGSTSCRGLQSGRRAAVRCAWGGGHCIGSVDRPATAAT